MARRLIPDAHQLAPSIGSHTIALPSPHQHMKYPEEDTAKRLHQELTKRFDKHHTTTSITGRGVNWTCSAARGTSECTIACLHLLAREYIPQYCTSFVRNGDTLAIGRTTSRDETIKSVADWLDGNEVAYLHSTYSFVDRTKRALSKLRDAVLSTVADLPGSSNTVLHCLVGDIYSLRFCHDDRSCDVSFYGTNEHPDAKFSWDDCQLFEFRADDVAQLTDVVDKWLCHKSMPSAMRAEFPWLQIGELADHYEDGNPIEGEFIQSWNGIERFYKEDWCTFSESVLALIHAMREAGYDRVLRVGQSMSSLGLSRARRHGLTQNQHRIWFQFHNSVMDVDADFSESGLKNHPVEFTDDVRKLVETLTSYDIE